MNTQISAILLCLCLFTTAALTAPEVLPAEAPAAAVASLDDPAETARALIGEPVEALIEAIGEPQSSDYAPSCLVDGEDGNWYYDGFIVYTLRTADGETVYDVE